VLQPADRAEALARMTAARLHVPRNLAPLVDRDATPDVGDAADGLERALAVLTDAAR